MSTEQTLKYAYKIEDKAEHAYFVRSDRIYIELKDGELFPVEFHDGKKGIIFGTTELFFSDIYTERRIFSVKLEFNQTESVVSRSVVFKQIQNFEEGLSIGKTIALILVNLDKITVEKIKELEELELRSSAYSKIFSWAVDKLLYHIENEPGVKWLHRFYLTKRNTIMYTKGTAPGEYELSHIILKDNMSRYFVQLNRYYRNFKNGSFVCKEGEVGDEFYILKRGVLRIWINNRAIKEINKPGSIVGDMIFWLGEKRTASVQALTDSIIVVVKKVDLDKILAINPDFLKTCMGHLSHCIAQHCYKISELNKDIAKMNKYTQKAKEELTALQEDFKSIMQKSKGVAWLKQINQRVNEKLLELKG